MLLMLRVLASSSRQLRTHSVRAEALLLTQLHVKHEGVAEAVHTIKTLLFLNIHPFNLMNAAQASKCRPVSEIITEIDRIAFSIFYSEMQSPFCISSRSQSLEEEWRGTESMFLEVQCEVSTVSDDLGCHVICWCWSTVFSEVHSQSSCHLPGNVRALHASFC